MKTKRRKRRRSFRPTPTKCFATPLVRSAENLNGDVTLVEFFDYNCPYCRQMAPVMIKAEEADPQLRVVYKEFPILGPNSTFAARAALAAHKQAMYVALHRALYQVRGPVNPGQDYGSGRHGRT